MKLLVKILITFCLLEAILQVESSVRQYLSVIKTNNSDSIKILCVGDSNIIGLSRAFRNLVSKNHPQIKFHITTHIRWGLNFVEMAKISKSLYKKHSPDIIFIMLGVKEKMIVPAPFYRRSKLFLAIENQFDLVRNKYEAADNIEQKKENALVMLEYGKIDEFETLLTEILSSKQKVQLKVAYYKKIFSLENEKNKDFLIKVSSSLVEQGNKRLILAKQEGNPREAYYEMAQFFKGYSYLYKNIYYKDKLRSETFLRTNLKKGVLLSLGLASYFSSDTSQEATRALEIIDEFLFALIQSKLIDNSSDEWWGRRSLERIYSRSVQLNRPLKLSGPLLKQTMTSEKYTKEKSFIYKKEVSNILSNIIDDFKGAKTYLLNYPNLNSKQFFETFQGSRAELIDSEFVFKKQIKKGGFYKVFIDRFQNQNFGHMTRYGAELFSLHIYEQILPDLKLKINKF
jgi:hypothetical protein